MNILNKRVRNLEMTKDEPSEPLIILRELIAPDPSGPASLGVKVAHTQEGSFYRADHESDEEFLRRAGIEPSTTLG